MADRYLERIVSYLACTSGLGLAYWLYPDDILRIEAYVDADHAGCPFSARSTSGQCVYLRGDKGSQALVAWSSHRQKCVATSTGEAELVAIGDMGRRYILPLAAAFEQMLKVSVPAIVATDSAAALSAAISGVSASMKYLRKNHRISIAAVRDYQEEVGLRYIKIDGTQNPADILTKALDPGRFASLRSMLGVCAFDSLSNLPPDLPTACTP